MTLADSSSEEDTSQLPPESEPGNIEELSVRRSLLILVMASSSALRTGLRGTLAPMRNALLGNSQQAGSSVVARRTMAAEAGEAPKVNMWEAPTAISTWKEEHIVLFVLGCWGVVIGGSMKVFGGKKAEPAAK